MTCWHPGTETVRNTVTGEPYAELCARCLVELPLGFSCPDCVKTEVQSWAHHGVVRTLVEPCRRHREEGYE